MTAPTASSSVPTSSGHTPSRRWAVRWWTVRRWTVRWWAARWWTVTWPVVTAVGFVLLIGSGDPASFAALLPLLPAIYAGVLATGRRSWTWPVVLVGVLLCAVLLELVPPLSAQLVTSAVAAALLAVVVGHGAHREAARQAVGVVGFGSVAVIGLLAAPDIAGWAVAAGWLGHGAWDLWHLLRDAVVSRTFATWCAVVDLLVGVQLVVVIAAR